VTCRRWNWRQARRTQLTDDTTRAFFVFDRLNGLTVAELHHAADELSTELRKRWPECRLDRVQRLAI
jgi:DNA/RNA-binding domain of Phe-tRNA-synthetase-like protein